MATIFMVLVALMANSATALHVYPFILCPLFVREGSCWPGNQCPQGTVESPFQSLFSWPACNEDSICCSGTPVIKCENDPLCGQWGPTARLAFSQTQVPRQAPYQVSLRRVINPSFDLTYQNSLHFGGGVLIQDKWVITDPMAALSTGRQNENENFQTHILVVLGDYNISIPEIYNNVPQEQIRRVKSATFHPGFRYNTLTTLFTVFRDAANAGSSYFQANAFCLLELMEPVNYNDWVRPICLPPANVPCNEGQFCRITGWGIDENERLKNLLQVAYLDLFTKSASEFIAYYISNATVVALPDNVKFASNTQSSSSCLGDFGGPLACDDPSNGFRTTLQGIMTFNLLCNTDSTVMISDVPNVVEWVWDTCRAAQGN